MKFMPSIKWTCFCLLFLMQFSLSGQVEFRPGYIIDNSSEKIEGLIGYDYWTRNPDEVQFRANGSGSTSTYKPSDIRGFGLDNYNFESTKILINKLFDEGDKFDEAPEVEYVERSVFLEVIVEGTKQLYKHKDESGYYRFFIKRGGEIEWLSFVEYWQNTPNGGFKRVDVKKYWGQLSSYLSDCADIEEKIKSIDYRTKDLMSLFKSYYKCTGTNESVVFKKNDWPRPVRSVKIGPTFNTIEFVGNAINLTEADFSTSLGFAVGVGSDFFLSRRKTVSVNASLLYIKYQTEGEHHRTITTRSLFTKTNVKFSSIRLQILPRYYPKFLNKKAFISFGYSIGTISFNENSRVEETTVSGMTFESRTEAVDEPSKSYGGLMFGFGGHFRKYSFEVYYEQGSDIDEVTSRDVMPSTVLFLVGYRL